MHRVIRCCDRSYPGYLWKNVMNLQNQQQMATKMDALLAGGRGTALFSNQSVVKKRKENNVGTEHGRDLSSENSFQEG